MRDWLEVIGLGLVLGGIVWLIAWGAERSIALEEEQEKFEDVDALARKSAQHIREARR